MFLFAVGSVCVATLPSILPDAHAQATEEQPAAKISVSSATYGLNCGANYANNASDYLRRACDGKRSCSYPVADAAALIGDHCPGTPKNFDFTYVCGDEEKTGLVHGESVGKTAFLTCARPHVEPKTEKGQELVKKTKK
jgi:hypothetical protein